MAADLITKKTRYEFREFLVSWVLRDIEGAFDSADIACQYDHRPPCGGARRTLVEQYYASLDFANPRDVAKLIKAYEYVLTEALSVRQDPYTGKVVEPPEAARKLLSWLRKDGYDFADGRVVALSGAARVADLHAAARELDAPGLADSIRRIEAAIDADPALAIGSAKELVETCCKTILSERDVREDVDALALGPLIKRTAKELALVPETVPDAAKGAEVIRRVLSNLGSVAQGLAEIRNMYGTGHGRDGKRRGPSPRHARLAVGAAATLATFLFDTHRERESK